MSSPLAAPPTEAICRALLPQIITETRPGIHRAPFRIAVGSGRRDTCPWRRRTFPWSWRRSPDPCRRSGPCRRWRRPCRRSGPCRRWRRRTYLRRRRRSTVDMVAPARNRVAAAAAIAAPDLEVIFMSISSKKKFEGAPPEAAKFGRQAAPGDNYGAVRGLVTRPAKFILTTARWSKQEGPAPMPSPPRVNSGRSALDELRAHGVALAFPRPSRSPDPCRRSGPCRSSTRPCRRSGPCRRCRPCTCPAAALAGVDPVETTAPARNRVAAAAASVAPDLEFNFMTISSMIV